MKKKPIAKTLITNGRCSYLQLDAGHTPMGNPRRGYLVMHSSRGILACCDEGYLGRSAMVETFGEPAEYFMDLGTIKTTKSQLKELMKYYPDGKDCKWKLK